MTNKTNHRRASPRTNVASYQQQHPVASYGGKSKIILLLIEMFVGSLGFDRMYMGCYEEGFAKLFLFLSIFFFVAVSPVIAIVALIAWAAWAFFDYVIVIFNALARSQQTPWTFCRKSQWGSHGEVNNGFVLALFIVMVHIALFTSAPIILFPSVQSSQPVNLTFPPA